VVYVRREPTQFERTAYVAFENRTIYIKRTSTQYERTAIGGRN